MLQEGTCSRKAQTGLAMPASAPTTAVTDVTRLIRAVLPGLTG